MAIWTLMPRSLAFLSAASAIAFAVFSVRKGFISCADAVPHRNSAVTIATMIRPFRFPKTCSMFSPSTGSVFQAQLLHSPVHELSDVQGVGIAAVNLVDHAEFLELLAGAADTAEHRPVQLHFVNLAIQEGILGRVGVGAVEKLVR